MAQQGKHDQSAAIKEAVDELQRDMKTLHANAETAEEQEDAKAASAHLPDTRHVVNLGNAFNDAQNGGKKKSRKSRKSKK